MAALGYRTFDEMIGQMQMLDTRKVVDHWKARGPRLLAPVPQARRAAEGVAIYHCEEQDHELDDVLDRKLIAQALAGARRPPPGQDRGDDQQHRPHRRRHALRRGRQALRPCRPARRHHPRHAHRHRRPELRRLGRRTASRSTSIGEANDYVGKGLSGGRLVVRPPDDGGHRAGRVDHRRQHRPLRRHRRRVLFPRRRRRALRRPQLRRRRRRRGRRRPLLRVHDRRRRRGARHAPAATSPPACRAASPMCSTRTARFEERCNLSMVELEPVTAEEESDRALPCTSSATSSRTAWSTSWTDMTRFDAERLHQLIAAARALHRLAPRPRDPRQLGGVPAEVPQGHAGRVPPGARRDGARPGRAADRGRRGVSAMRRQVDASERNLPLRVARQTVHVREARRPASSAGLSIRSTSRNSSRMGKVTGFLEIDRRDRKYLPAADRVRN